jgi:thiol-disulfide isomerase/thioredoxin
MPNINNSGSPILTPNATPPNGDPSPVGSETNENVANPAVPASNTPRSIQDIHDEFAADGFTDEELKTYIANIVNSPQPREHLSPLWAAVLNPKMPDEAHQDAKFFEVLSWYIDKSTSGAGDGRLSLAEVQEQLAVYGQRYLATSQDPAQKTSRLQNWKFIQKLRLLEQQIGARVALGEEAFYPYSPRDMMEIDGASAWNAEHTIDSRAEFNKDVIDASFDKPVLVKFGLTYCAHCLLLEQLGSVPAVSKKYGDALGVKKLWWNPHDPNMEEITRVAGEQGVTSSPFFILYDKGEIVKSGYAFPDENGEGMEDFLKGHLPSGD